MFSKNKVIQKQYERNCILWLMEEKQTIISSFGIEGYYTESDRNDILSWKDKIIHTIFRKMQKLIKFLNERGISDADICPFCIKNSGRLIKEEDYYLINEMHCSICTYGKRHGICTSEEKNTYSYIIFELEDIYPDYDSELYFDGIHSFLDTDWIKYLFK